MNNAFAAEQKTVYEHGRKTMKTKILSFIAGVMALIMLSSLARAHFGSRSADGDNFDEAPQNLTVELKEWEDGRPYFR